MQVAEALCDVIDCVAAQHGERIHMHHHTHHQHNHSLDYTDPRRTSFPSRAWASPAVT